MSDYHVVVLDVGKTNKKLLVYNSDLQCVNADEPSASFAAPPRQHDRLLTEDMPAIYEWMMDGLAGAAARFGDIRAISISTHGATIALLGQAAEGIFPGDGGLVFPIVSYEMDVGPGAEEEFFSDVGLSPDEAQRLTATARFGWLINHAKQIHFLQKTRPERFREVTDILMFPQYLGYLLTGEKGVEPTYLGCHGYLLDANGKDYSVIAERLDIIDKLPPLPARNTWDALGKVTARVAEKTGLPADCIVTMGAHDSNAALVPYFAKGLKDFVVQDSGTWVVTMAPREKALFADDELGREVFFNRSIYGGPVKTTIFRGGAEFDFFRTTVLNGKPHPAGVDLAALRKIVQGAVAFSLPTIERGSGLFPDSVSRLEGLDTMFASATSAWHTVDLGLAIQGHCAIEAAAGAHAKNVYIEGNVARGNPVYLSVLSSLMPEVSVFCGATGGAAFGAAIMGVAAAEGARPEELKNRFSMDHDKTEVLDIDYGALDEYRRAFLGRLV